jgi:gluconate 2-dehydrogenase gamma chain
MFDSSFRPHRRALLASTVAVLVASVTDAGAEAVRGSLPWSPDAGNPPRVVQPGPWQYFTPEEGVIVEALVDRLIPSDSETPGGKDAGVAVFIDRQLAGPYGSAVGLYMMPPFMDAPPQFGNQSPLTPAARYRASLSALNSHCVAAYVGKKFNEIPVAEQDKLISAMEKGSMNLNGANARAFFAALLQNAMEGFFADPVYGGNRDMVAWKMIGFPGARYDYRDWVERHNERYPLPPVSIAGRPAWTISK